MDIRITQPEAEELVVENATIVLYEPLKSWEEAKFFNCIFKPSGDGNSVGVIQDNSKPALLTLISCDFEGFTVGTRLK